jgi:DNA-binding YbaB/EbfC family protein
MQENLKKAQEELAQMEVSGEAASGKVKVEMSCKHVVKRVHIDPSVMDDHEMLEDLLTAAFNDATRKVEQTSEQ